MTVNTDLNEKEDTTDKIIIRSLVEVVRVRDEVIENLQNRNNILETSISLLRALQSNTMESLIKERKKSEELEE